MNLFCLLHTYINKELLLVTFQPLTFLDSHDGRPHVFQGWVLSHKAL